MAVLTLHLALTAALVAVPPTTDFEVFRWSFLPTVDTFRFVLTPPTAIKASAHAYQLELQGHALKATRGTVDTAGALPTPTAGVSWRVPTLPAGQYTLSLRLLDASNNTVATYIDSFNRTVQSWEGTELGREDLIHGLVIPPYKPIQQQTTEQGSHATVSLGFLGKSLTIDNATGLWSQVEAEPQRTPRLQRACTECKTAPLISLLAGPMELAVVSGGVKHSSRGTNSSTLGPMERLEVSPTGHLAHTSTAWIIGPLAGSTNATYVRSVLPCAYTLLVAVSEHCPCAVGPPGRTTTGAGGSLSRSTQRQSRSTLCRSGYP
jgi:hypothetical protein